MNNYCLVTWMNKKTFFKRFIKISKWIDTRCNVTYFADLFMLFFLQTPPNVAIKKKTPQIHHNLKNVWY